MVTRTPLDDTLYYIACFVDQLSYESDSLCRCVMEFQMVLTPIQLTVGIKQMTDVLHKT